MLLELLDISGEIPCVDYKHIQNSEVSREFTSRIKQNKTKTHKQLLRTQ